MFCDDLQGWGGKEVQEGGVICIHIIDSLGCIAETNTTFALISHASKVMFKILQARLQQYVNREFQMFKLVLEKAEEPEIKL